MDIDYTALREINTGVSPVHVAGTDYAITVSLSLYDLQRKVKKKEARSLSGVGIQTTVHRTDETWKCKTVPLSPAEAANFREFLSSVDQGERFDVESVPVTLVKDFRESRAIQYGGGGALDYFIFAWSHRAA